MIFTNLPTHIAEHIVPIPTPLNSSKYTNDRIEAIMINVTSKYTLTVPNFIFVVIDKAFTIPSPGTVITFGATSTTIPNAKIIHPKIILRKRIPIPVG